MTLVMTCILDPIPKIQSVEERNDKLDFTGINNSCSAKDKRQLSGE